jgi:hypothetical protein
MSDKQKQSSGAHSAVGVKSNYEGQECESLRKGHQAATREAVKPVVENKTAHSAAKAARYESNGEPSAAPRVDEVGQ